jgi:phosphoribosylformylglycinamidine synthase
MRQNLQFISEQEMKAKVYVTLKPGVLDPQGKAIHHSVELLGFLNVEDIRQGKYFEIAMDGSATQQEAKASAEKIAKNVLANPVIEDYRVELIENGE